VLELAKPIHAAILLLMLFAVFSPEVIAPVQPHFRQREAVTRARREVVTRKKALRYCKRGIFVNVWYYVSIVECA
jgi:hypothetical protein